MSTSRPRKDNGRRGIAPKPAVLARTKRITLETLKRSPEVVELKVSELHIPEFEADPRFQNLWSSVLNAQSELAHTRVLIDDIFEGFVRADGRTIVREPPPSEEDIADVQRYIRAGHRPTLHIYEPEITGLPRYACSDDMVSLCAYRGLGFTYVPVAMMGSPTSPVHSLLCVKAVRVPDGHRFFFTRTISGATELRWDSLPKYATLGDTIPPLIARLTVLLERLRRFHLGGEGIHYHHMVAAALVRSLRLFDSLSQLLCLGRGDAAITLARAIYEIATAFYVDWLAPEFIGPAYADAARGPREDFDRALNAVYENHLNDGWDAAAADAAKRGTRELNKLVSSIGARARLSPLRAAHSNLYRRLSHVAHQDAAAACDFAGYLAADINPFTIDSEALSRDAGVATSTSVAAITLLANCIEGELR